MQLKGLIYIKKETLVRAMIEGAVNLVLKKVESDPKRSIRNLIELAMNNSHGRFQRSFFEDAQRMLANEDSAYYTLADRVISKVDHNILKKFGINLGYNGCTCGAKKIRQNETRLGFNIPWAIYIDTDGADDKFADAISKIISEGMELGVYVYIVFGKHSLSRSIREVYRRFDECAFIAACQADSVSESLPDDFDGIYNAAFSVSSDNMQKLERACEILREGRRLYGIHEYYNDASAQNLLTDNQLERYKGTEGVFVCCISEDGCASDTLEYTKSRVREIRFGQMYPYFAMDFAADMDEIDHIISDDTCWVCFSADRTIYSCTGKYSGSEYDITANPLSDILRRVTPPKQV